MLPAKFPSTEAARQSVELALDAHLDTLAFWATKPHYIPFTPHVLTAVHFL